MPRTPRTPRQHQPKEPPRLLMTAAVLLPLAEGIIELAAIENKSVSRIISEALEDYFAPMPRRIPAVPNREINSTWTPARRLAQSRRLKRHHAEKRAAAKNADK